MSRYDHHQSSDPPGWPLVQALIALIALLTLAPALLLGAAGLYAWRRYGWRRRWAFLALALSLVPFAAAIRFRDATPPELLGTFAAVQFDASYSTALWLAGRSDFPSDLTPAVYLGAVGPALPLLAVLCAFALGLRFRPKAPALRTREATGVEVPRRVERRASAGVAHPPDGWALGYRADGKAVAIADAESRQHAIVCGSPGAGKTTVVRLLVEAVAERCPLVIVDGKASPALRRAVAAVPGSVTWMIGGPLAWDALRGDPTCFASKMLAAEQFGPNAAVYRAAAERYVQWVGRLLEATGTPRDPRRVAELLSPKAFAAALRELRAEAEPRWWAAEGEPIARRLSEMGKAEEEGVAGFAARFGVVVEGVAARSLGSGPGAIVLEDLVADGRTVLFSLDAAAYPTLAAKIGAWVLLDLVRVAGLLQERAWPEAGRQLYVVVDEFSALGAEGRHVVPLLARAREAGVAVVLATQGLADLERVDRALPQQVVQNAAVRVLLRQGSAEDAQAWARHAGELEREELSRRTDELGRDVGEGYARWRRAFYVRPAELQALGIGEAVVDVAPVLSRKRRLERVRIAQPRGGSTAAAPAERVVLDLGVIKILDRSPR